MTNVPDYQQNTPESAPFVQPSNQAPEDSGSFGWAVLGFFIPIVGIVLYFVWKNTKPLSAKKASIGAIVGIIVGVLWYIFSIAMLMNA